MDGTSIPRLSAREFSVHGLLRNNRPAIITDALSSWSVKNFWTPLNLATVLKHRQLSVSVSTNKKFGYKATGSTDRSTFYSVEVLDFPSIVRLVTQPNEGTFIYAMGASIPDKLPELMSHLEIPRWVPTQPTDINLWLGRKTITPLHFDSSNNFFAQVHGAKKFTVFSPCDSPYLYPYEVGTSMPHVSYVDAECPDLARYPRFHRATPIRFIVNAGELMFLPAFWWHQVQSDRPSISVNFWWQPTFEYSMACSNGLRSLYRWYCSDKLKACKQNLLAPCQLDFLGAAQLLLQCSQERSSAIMSLAAFHELAETLDAADRGGSPLPLPRDLQEAFHRVQEMLPSVEQRAADENTRYELHEVLNIIDILMKVESEIHALAS